MNSRARSNSRRTEPRSPARPSSLAAWEQLPYPDCLDVRLCDLGLTLESTRLEEAMARLAGELERAGLCFRPYAWLSTDWFTPDGVTGFAIPFYLAHPRLTRIERKHMHGVEGGSEVECMKLLRHETAHALDNAYDLHRRRRWREVFGAASTPYLSKYDPSPKSKRCVRNLDRWYAQSHPLEDFAETFAVWLRPRSNWRRGYAGWPALQKLLYVDELMNEIGRVPPVLRTRRRSDPLSQVKTTLADYYEQKREHYRCRESPQDRTPARFDRELRSVFKGRGAGGGGRERAATFLRRVRPELRRRVARATGHDAYLVDQALTEMVHRTGELELWLADPAERSSRCMRRAAKLLAEVTAAFLRGGRPEYRR